MSWKLKGSYVETCSCELMCPCNLSLDHGATYDFCRVTLVFDIREGEIDGTDIAGLKVAAIADTDAPSAIPVQAVSEARFPAEFPFEFQMIPRPTTRPINAF